MIDIHAHLCFESFAAEKEKVALECRRSMEAVIVGTARYDECVCALDLCGRHEKLFPTLGYHPAEGGSNVAGIMELARKRRKDIVGIGEVGLDYHWVKDEQKRKMQRSVFSDFIALAEELGKPLVIHSWDAEEECFEMVRGVSVPVIFHCYSGSRQLAERILSRGFLISMSTHVLFSKDHRKLARDLPLSGMLLETDAPFLSPYNYLKAKGQEGLLKEGFDPQKNYPWNIAFSAQKIAEIKGATAEDVIAKTSENAKKIFRLKSPDRE
jgi:TatD DNase family protein